MEAEQSSEMYHYHTMWHNNLVNHNFYLHSSENLKSHTKPLVQESDSDDEMSL
jgi:hypothetical protein